MSENSSLILTRKTGEKIVIDETIEITVIEQGPGRTRLKFDLPREMRVRRGESPAEPRKPKTPPLAVFMPNRAGGRHGLPIDVSWSA